MPVNINTKMVPTAEQIAARNKARAKLIGDFANPLSLLEIELDSWVQRNFKTEGGNVGGWQPFAHGGRWIKGYGLDQSAKLLQDKGVLRASFRTFKTRRSAGIGSDLPYSKKHEEGIGVPARRMLPMDKDMKPRADKIFKEHVARGIDK